MLGNIMWQVTAGDLPLGGYGGLWPTSSEKLFLTALQP